MPAVLSQLDLNFDPAIVTFLTAIVWPLIQAALDKPWWTATRRRVLVAVAALVLSIVIWFTGAYPLTWQMILTQAGLILGYATAAYWILQRITINGVSLLDWVGLITPGGETRIVEGAATVTGETPSATPQVPDVKDAGGVTAVPNTEGPSLEGEDHTA